MFTYDHRFRFRWIERTTESVVGQKECPEVISWGWGSARAIIRDHM